MITLKENQESPILTPDFKEYQRMFPSDLVGINTEQVRLNGWTLKQSYFSYLDKNKNLSTLVFNIMITRNLIGPFITYLFPLGIILALSFFSLLMWTKDDKQRRLWGFNFSNILTSSSSLFFILLLSHISLRDALEAKGFIFLEYYYLATYSLIVYITVTTMLYLSNKKHFIINFHDGLILKILYWPYFLMFCLIASLLYL